MRVKNTHWHRRGGRLAGLKLLEGGGRRKGRRRGRELMVIRLLLVTIPLSTFLLQTNLVLQLLYFFGVPVGRKNRQKDDQTCSAGWGGGKSSTDLWSRNIKRQESSKHLHMLNNPISSELTHCYKSPSFCPQDERKTVCIIEFNRTINSSER